MNGHYPAFGICGFSGSGKTTVIEEVIGSLARRGLKVGIVKHDVHGLNIDREGKDSDRFFRAGADVIIRGPKQCFFRAHRSDDVPLRDLARLIGPYFDLVLVEGHKATPLEQKVWLCSDAGEGPPPEATGIQRVLRRDEDRVRIVMEMIDAWLPRAWRASPVYAGILIGGKSSRLGRPKHLLGDNGKTWLERSVEKVRPHVDGVAILGAGAIPDGLGSVPVLCDIQDAEGPLAGMLAATRWRPLTSWLFLPCDTPLLSEAALRWLIDHRRPGVWAVLPRLPEAPGPEPLLAYYDFRAGPMLERAQRPVDLTADAHVVTPAVPDRLQASWKNVNTDEDLAIVCRAGIVANSSESTGHKSRQG